MRPVKLLPISIVFVAASCGAGNPSDADDRASAIYVAALRVIVSDWSRENPAATADTSVFVAAADEQARISLEVQAEVVDELHDVATIRFVDDRLEAIKDADRGRPVREEGVLVVLSRVPSRGNDVTIEAERYKDVDDVRTYRLSVRRTGSTWVVRSVATD